MQTITAAIRPQATPAAIAMRGAANMRPGVAGQSQVLDKGDELFAEGDDADFFYKVVSGSVRSYKLLSDGRRQIDAFYLPGDIFGLEAGAEHRFTAEAVESTAVLAFRRSRLAELTAGDAAFGEQVMVSMMRSLERAQGHMLLLGRKTAGALTDELAGLGARLMVQVLADLAGHPPIPQAEAGVTYAAKIDKAEARIDWRQSAAQIERQVRAFNPAPGAFFEHGGERLKLLRAEVVDASGVPGTVLDGALTIACGLGSALRPTLVQRAGRAPMTAAELLRGFPIPPGTQL